VTTDEALILARQAQTWRTRPSELIGVRNPLVALVLDDALALRLASPGRRMDRSRQHERGAKPAGLAYEDLTALARAVAAREGRLN
jgi:hypothetical protein